MRITAKLLSMPLLAMILASSGASAQVRKNSAGSEAVNYAVQSLWSEDERISIAAREQLIDIGPAAITALVSLLESLNATAGTGRQIAKGAGDQARRDSRYRENPSAQYPTDPRIIRRVRGDAVELLGRMRAIEAVPGLIQFLKEPMIMATNSWSINGIMKALIQIGAPAIPQLLAEIDSVQAESTSWGFDVHVGLSDEEKQELRFREIATIQNKLVIVLGEIGDEQALPILEKLLVATREPILLNLESDYVKEAVLRIREQSRLRLQNRSR